MLFTLYTKQATLVRRSTVLSLPPQLVFTDETMLTIESLTNIKGEILNSFDNI
jgi:hypothetical protein